MTHLQHYNTTRTIVDVLRDSHVNLIENLCSELGHSDRSDEMVKKFIDFSIKFPKFKDSAAPKKPKSSYLCFCEKNRAEVKKQLGDSANFASVVKKLASNWKEVSDKSEFERLADLDKERYTSALEAYKAELFKSNTAV